VNGSTTHARGAAGRLLHGGAHHRQALHVRPFSPEPLPQTPGAMLSIRPCTQAAHAGGGAAYCKLYCFGGAQFRLNSPCTLSATLSAYAYLTGWGLERRGRVRLQVDAHDGC